jgi:sugar/nucleoside kinase (ribokinase family)
VIVFIGHPAAVMAPEGIRPGGGVALGSLAAAAAGATVQLVGKLGDDAAGDAVILALAAGGVGHVALLRDPARPTPVIAPTEGEDLASDEGPSLAVQPADPDARPALEAPDVELGLRYLTDYRAILVAEPLSEAIVRVAADAATYAGAELVVVTAGDAPGGLPRSTIVLAAPPGDPGGALASVLGRVGAGIETGQSASEALADAVAGLGAVRSE